MNIADFLCLCALIALASATPGVFKISTAPDLENVTSKSGSMMGGTRLRIQGRDFEENEPKLSNIVKVGNKVCEIIEFHSSGEHIECLTPSPDSTSATSTVPISLLVNGNEVAIEKAVNPTFTYSWDRTPVVYFMTPFQAPPGYPIAFYGKWLTANQAYMYEFRVGNKRIELDDLNESVEYTTTGLFNITGYLGDNTAGDAGVTARIDGNQGLAFYRWTASSYDLDGTEYKFKTIPLVESISANAGSPKGGHLLTIHGAGFPLEKDLVGVTVGGLECTVKSVKYAEITCETTERVSEPTAPFPGSAGLKRQVWSEQSGDIDDIEDLIGTTEKLTIDDVIPVPDIPQNSGENIRTRLWGYFKAPRTGDYTFHMASDDKAKVFLSTDSTPDNKAQILYLNGWTGYRALFTRAELKSAAIPLEADKYYYLEIWHTQGGGIVHFNLGVEVPGVPGTPSANPLPQINKIAISPTTNIVRERQVIRIPAGKSGALRVRYGDLYTTYITGAMTSGANSYYMWSTSTINSEMTKASFPSISCSMTRNSATGELDYSFTFNYPWTDTRSEIWVFVKPTTGNIETYIPMGALKVSPTYAIKGSFALTIDGVVTKDIAIGASASTVYDAIINAAPTLRENISVEGSSNGDGGTYAMMLPGALSNGVPTISINSAKLTGGGLSLSDVPNAAINLEPTNSENLFYWVIPSEFLRTAEDGPQVVVTGNGLGAMCSGDCSYSYLSGDSIPSITNLSESGTDLIFEGTNFPTSDISITVGHAECSNVVATSVQITCTKPQAEAGQHTPVVKSSAIGIIPYSSSLVSIPSVFYSLTITGASPAKGSLQGGLILTINGSGFPPSMDTLLTSFSVTIGNANCEVIETTSSYLRCITGAQSGDNAITITVGIETTTSSGIFEYSSDSTPTITNYSPLSASTYSTTLITITGSGFNTDKSKIKVKIGEEECLIVTSTETEIQCNLLGGPKGTHLFSVYVEGKGKSTVSVTTNYPLVFEITAVTPNTGSTLGGTLLRVSGSGFSTIASQNLVLIGHQDAVCNIEQVIDAFTILCRTPSITDANAVAEEMNEVYMLGRISAESDSCADCNFKYSADATPIVTSITPANGVSGDSITILGSGFGSSIEGARVKLGADCTVTSVTDTAITFTLPDHPAGVFNLELVIDSLGKADTTGITYTYGFAVDSFTPKQGSRAGNIVNIVGKGLSKDCTVTFGTVSCSILSATTTSIQCLTAAFSASESPQLHGVDCAGLSYDCADATCGFSFLSSLTPSVSSAIYDSNTDLVTISGAGFLDSIDSDMNIVTIGKAPCTVSEASTTQLKCTPHGEPTSSSLKVYVKDKGYASGSFSLTIPLKIDSLSSTSGSFAGGNAITLTGKGLGPDTSILVCGQVCAKISGSYSSYECQVPSLATIYSQTTYSITAEDGMLHDISYFSSPAASGFPVKNVYDDNQDTYFRSSVSLDCFIGIDAGENWTVQLYSFMVFPFINSAQKYKDLNGGKLQGSDDQVTWDDLYVIQGPFEGMNSWTVPQNRIEGDNYPILRYRYYRYLGYNNCFISEIHFKGARLYNGSTTTQECNVTAKYGVVESVSSTRYTYSAAVTPKLTDIEPKFGTTAGGFEINFTVEDVILDSSKLSIKVDDVECTNISVSGTRVTCTAGARSEYVTPSIVITQSDIGNVATRGLTFLYAERWSDERTWGGVLPPREGETVHIPTGQTLIIDQETPILNLVTVEGILMIEDKVYSGPVLQAHYIMIKGGHFIVGTEEEPFQNNCEIILHGRRDDPEIPIYGNKVIAVRNGILDLHGVERTPTWTMLESTAEAGASQITVQEDVDWVTGDVIVIASTSFNHMESEQRSIVSKSGRILTLDKPLRYKHYAATETYGTDTIDMRAEVGLLTRNIRIHGVETNPKEEHGVHIMIASPGDETSIGRIENVEIYNAGQAFSLGRYPIHFHMIGKVMKSYIRNNSIHHTHNRACTIHGVHYLRVINNVAYHNKGHAFFIEDGIETKNIIMHNLGISTLQSWSLLNTDQSPATFWITNIDNQFINNHAAGSDRYGFWFDPPDNPTGFSATSLICPKGVKLGRFEGNTAHSNGRYGLRLFHGHVPRERPCDNVKDDTLADPWSFNPTIPAVYKDFTGWKCGRNGAIGEDIGDVTFEGFKVADNILAGIEITYVGLSKPFVTTKISNAVIIGKSANSQNNVAGFVGLITSQKDGLFTQNVRFYNIDNTMYSLGDESHSSHAAARDFGARHHKFAQLTFNNANKRVHWEVPKRGIFEFLDNTMTGTAGAFLAAYWPHLETPECEYQEELYNSVVCDGTVKVRRINFYNNQPFARFNFKDIVVYRLTGAEIKTETVTNEAGVSVSQAVKSRLPMMKAGKNIAPSKSWAVPFVTGYKYSVSWGETLLDWEGFTAELEQFVAGDFVAIQMPHMDVRQFYQVNRGTNPANTNTSAPGYVDATALTRVEGRSLLASDPAGAFRFDNVTEKYFEVAFTGTSANSVQKGDIKVKAYRCYGSSCSDQGEVDEEKPEVVTIKRWSDSKAWASEVLPAAGEKVTILADTEMFVDISTPILDILEVQGKLTFDPEKSASIHTKILFNRKGTITSGSLELPTNPEVTHEIVLHGITTDDSYVFDPKIEAGNKVLINTGEMNLYGAPKKSWVKLAMNAYPGDEWIFVDEVDWSVGDEIVIGSSGFDSTEIETFTISEIVGGIPPYEQPTTGTRRLEERHSTYDFSTDSLWVSKNLIKDTGKSDQESFKSEFVNPPAINITKLKLSAPLQYYHIGVANKVGSTTVDMRAEVAVLNRNVKIRGDGNSWKCNVLVAEYLDFATTSDDPVTRAGFVNLDNIEIKDCGQNDVDRTSIRFEKTTTKSSKVTNSVLRNSDTYGLSVKDASKIEFSNNVIHYSKRIGVAVMSTNGLVLTNNLVVEVRAREIVDMFDFPTAYWLCENSCSNMQATGNVASGYVVFGFFLPAVACTGDTNVIENNVAHSGRIGFTFRESGLTCMKSDGVTAYLNSEVGVANKASFELFTISSAKLAENTQGISILGNARAETNKFILRNSVILGQTVHTKCDESLCNAEERPAECGPRAGLVSNTFAGTGSKTTLTSKIKFPILQLSDPAENLGVHLYSDISFSNFMAPGYCNVRHSAISSSPASPDYTTPQFLTRFSFTNIEGDSMVYMHSANPGWANINDCGNWPCTGPYNTFFKDKDGSYFGNSLGGYILPNNPGVARKGYCSFSMNKNAYLCPKSSSHKSDYAILIFQSLDADKMDRMLSPVYVKSYDGILQANNQPFYNMLNSFMDHVWDGFYSGQKRLSRFPSLIELGRFYNITFTGSPAVDMKYQLQGTDNNQEAVILDVDYVRPNTVRVFINGTYTEPLKYVQGDTNHCTLDHPSGTNKWFYDLSKLQFVIRSYDIVELKITNSVQMAAKFEMTLDEFFADNGVTNFIDRLAAILGIPSYRIRVVNVKQGSVIVQTEIIGDLDLADDSEAELAELKNIQNKIITDAQAGTLDLGYPLKSISTTILISDTTDSDSGNSDEPIVIDIPDSGDDDLDSDVDGDSDDSDSDSDGDSDSDSDTEEDDDGLNLHSNGNGTTKLKISNWYFLLLIAFVGVMIFIVPLAVYLYIKRRSKVVDALEGVVFTDNTPKDSKKHNTPMDSFKEQDSYRLDMSQTQNVIDCSERPLDPPELKESTSKFLLDELAEQERIKKTRTITVTADL